MTESFAGDHMYKKWGITHALVHRQFKPQGPDNNLGLSDALSQRFKVYKKGEKI